MKKLILIILLFLVQDVFSYQKNYQANENDFDNQDKYEISLGVGSLFYYGLSFKQYLSSIKF